MSDQIHQTREVLAAAYTGNRRRLDGPLLTHTVRVTTAGVECAVLCKRVKLDSIADAHADPTGLNAPPTCPVCLRRDPRFARQPRAAGAGEEKRR
jgi:hypothetical protein